MIFLWGDPVEGEDQSGSKGDAVDNGHPLDNRSPLDGWMLVLHTAQGTSMT